MEIFYCGGDPNTLKDARHAGPLWCVDVSMACAPVGTIGGNRQPEINAYSAQCRRHARIHKTSSADMDADAPAGTVNMKSRERVSAPGTATSRFQLYGLVNSYELQPRKINGPNDGQTHETLPGISLDYSDVYLDGKLGVRA